MALPCGRQDNRGWELLALLLLMTVLRHLRDTEPHERPGARPGTAQARLARGVSARRKHTYHSSLRMRMLRDRQSHKDSTEGRTELGEIGALTS